jgi:hypothetical protein
MAAEVLVLRLVHILGGIAWVGFAAFNTYFLIPSLGEAGPAAGPVMGGGHKFDSMPPTWKLNGFNKNNDSFQAF